VKEGEVRPTLLGEN